MLAKLVFCCYSALSSCHITNCPGEHGQAATGNRKCPGLCGDGSQIRLCTGLEGGKGKAGRGGNRDGEKGELGLRRGQVQHQRYKLYPDPFPRTDPPCVGLS